ncbi:hypothetical protein Anapl_02917 [Anas platyrhynchos]|uniref:Uncharacterized protein n=1 Tax=Anas platyrhynchos TaxID=8839 RepID=R0KZI5_ANAPL|nr:hypothetical protein Anapl_02917 [Anas platyrhynchos]
MPLLQRTENRSHSRVGFKEDTASPIHITICLQPLKNLQRQFTAFHNRASQHICIHSKPGELDCSNLYQFRVECSHKQHVSEGKALEEAGLQGRSQAIPEPLEDTLRYAVHVLRTDIGCLHSIILHDDLTCFYKSTEVRSSQNPHQEQKKSEDTTFNYSGEKEPNLEDIFMKLNKLCMYVDSIHLSRSLRLITSRYIFPGFTRVVLLQTVLLPVLKGPFQVESKNLQYERLTLCPNHRDLQTSSFGDKPGYYRKAGSIAVLAVLPNSILNEKLEHHIPTDKGPSTIDFSIPICQENLNQLWKNEPLPFAPDTEHDPLCTGLRFIDSRHNLAFPYGSSLLLKGKVSDLNLEGKEPGRAEALRSLACTGSSALSPYFHRYRERCHTILTIAHGLAYAELRQQPQTAPGPDLRTSAAGRHEPRTRAHCHALWSWCLLTVPLLKLFSSVLSPPPKHK